MELKDIKARDWSISLEGIGTVVENIDDVAQGIRIILLTRKGELALDPLFGCDIYQFVDKPISEARPGIVQAVFDGVSRYEKRVKIESVTVNQDSDSSLIVQMRFTIISTGIIASMTIAI